MRAERALVVEDDARLAGQIAAVLEDHLVREVRTCGDLVTAEEILEEFAPDLLVIDVCLPDGDADELLDLLHRMPPFPVTVAMSARAGPEVAFRLSRLGARAYLQKPFDLEALEDAVREALAHPADPAPDLRSSVGQVPLREVEARVRTTMVDEALKRAKGNRRAAARLLGVSRQFLQHVLRRRDDP